MKHPFLYSLSFLPLVFILNFIPSLKRKGPYAKIKLTKQKINNKNRKERENYELCIYQSSFPGSVLEFL